VSRAAMVQAATPRTKSTRPISKAKVARLRLRSDRPSGVGNQLGNAGSGHQGEEPDTNQLQRGKQPFRLKQQAEHHQAEAEVVCLGQCVQSAKCIREPEQPDCPRQEKKAPAQTAKMVSPSSAVLMPRPPPSEQRS